MATMAWAFILQSALWSYAIEKAEKFGLGMTVCRNSTHFGAAFYYARQAVEHGMIGMVTTNARPSIAPTWGVEPMLGTNPLTWGMPSDEDFPLYA